MRKFQYLVTLDIDDAHIEACVAENPNLVVDELKGVDEEDIVTSMAEKLLAEAMQETLTEGLGDAGLSKVSVLFAGEVK